jgi:hypothetical protein
MENKTTITRQDLYNLVWKESLTAISKRFNIPYTHLRKVCTEMNVPVPPNGHWSKLQFGKPVEVIELPQDYTGANEIKLYPSQNDISKPETLTFNKKSDVDIIKEDETLPLKVPKTLTNPDELIAAAQRRFLANKFDSYNDDGTARPEAALNIRVSRGNLGRALRFMDALIKLIRARGHSLSVKYGRYINIDGEDFKIKLMEKSKKLPPDLKGGYAKYEYTGLLNFTIDDYHGRTWTDGKVPIEEKLAEILAKIESIILYWQENHRINEEQKRKREEQERIIREQRQRIEKEKSDFKDLYQQAKRWQRVTFLRQYLDVVEERMRKEGRANDKFVQWMEWARAKTDWYDPLVNREDELLGYY